MPGPLEGIKVFDLTYGGVGPWSTMLLATMGANVIKVEDPALAFQRQGSGPQYQGISVIYMACNLGKRCIQLDMRTPKGKEMGWRLLKEADIFVDNMKLGSAERLGFGYEAVSKVNSRIVYDNCPGWGSSGPFKDWGSGDPTQQPFSGAVSITGKRNGEGEWIRWYALHDFNASLYITLTVLLGLLHRERTGKSIRMENPQAGASIAVQTSRIAEFLANGENPPRMGSACVTTVPDRAFLCQDKRWLAVGVITDAQWRGLCRAINAEDLLQDSRLATNPGRVVNREELEDRLQSVFASKPARWWIIQLHKEKVPASLFYDYNTLPDLPQVKANGLVIPIKYPRVGSLPFGKLPFQFSKTAATQRPGPWPGQHTEEVLKEGWGRDGHPAAKGYFGPKGPEEKGVLDGVTVVDMSQGLAGPYASLMLADAGARVIKVEPPEGDYTRQWGPPFVDGVGAAFSQLNRNKEGMRLDVRKKKDRQRLLELLKTAHIFIEDEDQARMTRLGLGYRDLEKINPGLVYCTITPFGTKGPLRNQPASELVLQAMSDFPNTLGVAGEEPVRIGPDMANLLTSLYMAHGILAALYHKWHTGEGQQVTVNMLSALLHQGSSNFAAMIDPDDFTGFCADCYVKPPDIGYQTGDKRIGLSAVPKPEFPALLKALGMEAYLEHPLFQHPPAELMGRPGSPTDIATQVKPIWEENLKRWKADDLVQVLNRHGSRNGVVNTYKDMRAHPQVKALGMFQEVEGTKHGKVTFMVPPWKLYGVATVTPKPYKES